MAGREPDTLRRCRLFKGDLDVAWIDVRKNWQYAEVVLQFNSQPTPGTGSGLMLIGSDSGAYRYYWSHCGKPFPVFLTDISPAYLLSKISKEILRGDKVLNEFKETLLRHRRDGSITKETAREAYDTFPGLLGDYGAEYALTHAVQEEWICSDYLPIGKGYPEDDYQFVQELWPLVVQTIQEHLI